MQFDTLRAFPYPVLRPDVDDYTHGDIQVIVDFIPSEEGQDITAKVSFILSVPEIEELVTSGKARYASVFACRDTYYRKIEQRDHADFEVKFASGHLRGEVQVYSYVTAVEPIAGFECSLINPEFGDGPFSFEVGSVLAVDRPQVVYIDRDVFRPLTSIFVLMKDDNLVGPEWRIDASGDKVCIRVSDEFKKKIDAARNSNASRAILFNSIYFSAVMHCVSLLQVDDAPDYRWANIMRQKAHNAGIDLDEHAAYLVAERLLQFPLRLVDTYIFSKGEEQ